MDSDSPNVIAKRVFSKAAANLGCGIIELSSVPEEIWGVVKTYTAHNLYTQPPQLIPTDISLHNLYENWRQGAKTYTIFEINNHQFFSNS